MKVPVLQVKNTQPCRDHDDLAGLQENLARFRNTIYQKRYQGLPDLNAPWADWITFCAYTSRNFRWVCSLVCSLSRSRGVGLLIYLSCNVTWACRCTRSRSTARCSRGVNSLAISSMCSQYWPTRTRCTHELPTSIRLSASSIVSYCRFADSAPTSDWFSKDLAKVDFISEKSVLRSKVETSVAQSITSFTSWRRYCRYWIRPVCKSDAMPISNATTTAATVIQSPAVIPALMATTSALAVAFMATFYHKQTSAGFTLTNSHVEYAGKQRNDKKALTLFTSGYTIRA